MKKTLWYIFVGVAISLWTTAIVFGDTAASSNATTIPTPGMVTMVDLGADKCIPCKMMAPIIEELKEEYEGVVSINFIDVWKNPDEAKKYGIRTIPTQIFYGKDGKEVARHTGFIDKKSILEILVKLGAAKETVQE